MNDNLKALVYGRKLNAYQKSLAIQEFEKQEAAQQKGGYSEEDIFNFLTFYNNYDVRKIGRYQHPTMDNSSNIHNEAIDRQILKDYIQSLKKD